MIKPDPNTVVCHDDYIEVIWEGAQTPDKVRKSSAAILSAAEQLSAKAVPVRLLLVIRNHPIAASISVFKEALKIFQAASFERMAISGTIPPGVMTLVSTIISSFNKGLEIQYFKDPKEGFEWLRR